MDIVGKRKIYFTVSSALIVIGLLFMVVNIALGNGAFNYSVDFIGGTELTVDLQDKADTAEIQQIVTDVTGQTDDEIQTVGDGTQVSIKMQELDQDTRVALEQAFEDKYGIASDAFSFSDVSATVSQEMRVRSIAAILIAAVAILIYTTIRFRDLKTGSSALIALFHDVIIVVLSYAVFRMPLDKSFIAVVLTIFGFSINATIIIFDRVRENKNLLKHPTNKELVNVSINQTIKRCIYTSLTVLIACLCLFILGVTSIRDFTFPIMIGVICGTYSSICLSGSVWYTMVNRADGGDSSSSGSVKPKKSKPTKSLTENI